MEKQLENKTRLTVEEGCVRSYQCNFMLLQPEDFSKRVAMSVGRLGNDNSHMIMILAAVLLQNKLTALQMSQPIYS